MSTQRIIHALIEFLGRVNSWDMKFTQRSPFGLPDGNTNREMNTLVINDARKARDLSGERHGDSHVGANLCE